MVLWVQWGELVEYVLEKEPAGWSDYLALSVDESRLRRLLRARLVAIAFGGGSSSDCRAIESLLGMPGESVGDEADDDELDAAEGIARRYLEARAISSRPLRSMARRSLQRS